MRPPRPWFRSSHDAWYVHHNGKQVLLARGKANKAEAQAAFHKLMLLGARSAATSRDVAIETLCDLFLDFSQKHHSAAAYSNYKHFLQAFCTAFGRQNAADIKPFQVNAWIDGRKTWKGAKRHAVIAIKRAYSWGEQQGLLAGNPVRSLKVPRGKRRERVLSIEERRLILSNVKDESFREFLLALMGTGCRPSEVAGVTAAQVKLELGVWILTKHKSSKATGKPRVVYLSPEIFELTRKQIEKYPSGPLFPNTVGKPFTRNALNCRFRRLRKKFPNLAGVVCYSFRHTYATESLINGVGIAQVAELMGHTSTEMVSRFYGHIAANVEHLREAAAKAMK